MTGKSRLIAPGVLPTIGDLRRVRDMLLEMGDASSANVGAAIEAILRGADVTAALGLKASAGRRSALTIDRKKARDDLLRRLAARHCSGMSTSAQARKIYMLACEYRRRAARLDLGLEDMPSSYIGMPREFLFHIARLPAIVPSERTIRLVLAS